MSTAFSLVFATVLLLVVALQFWLALRQIRSVSSHAGEVPAAFADSIAPEQHRRAAEYTVAKKRLGIAEDAWAAVVVVALTLLGGLQQLNTAVTSALGHGLAAQVAIVAATLLLLTLLQVPADLWRQFRIEQRFGFNRMTWSLYFADAAKSLLVTVAFGLPLLALVLWLMQRAGALWWLYAWAAWMVVAMALQFVFPVWIAPLFNRFTPLADEALRERIDSLLQRTGFAARGVFTMDGSRRSSHGNAYFAGMGRSRRIVFFDTLLQRLDAGEIEAVLAHELGHFRLRHVTKRIAWSAVASLAALALLGWLAGTTWFYEGLGVEPRIDGGNEGVALTLFLLVAPVFSFVVAPLGSLLSRRHEYEADAFAAAQTTPAALVSALTKLYRDNASTLTPDPLHSAFFDSHPPASLRIARLQAAA